MMSETTDKLLNQACRLARKRGKAFGIEYFPDERKWRVIIAADPDVDGCWWSNLPLCKSRQKALAKAVAALSDTADTVTLPEIFPWLRKRGQHD